MERYYADGALGMGSLGQCNPKSGYAQSTGRSKYLENEKREATALLFQPCSMHRPEPVKKRQAYSVSVICPSPPRKRGPETAWSDVELTEHIREAIRTSPWLGEGHRKVWARLQEAGMRTSKARVLRLCARPGCWRRPGWVTPRATPPSSSPSTTAPRSASASTPPGSAKLLWVERSATAVELLEALHASKDRYNRTWLVQKHHHLTPAAARAALSGGTEVAP